MAATSSAPKLLVVEDEWLLAMQLVDILEEAGLAAEPAPSVQVALRVIEEEPLHAAILDISLGEETSFPVARELARRGVPFVFVTGYAETEIPDDLRGSTVLRKPVRPETLIARLRSMLTSSAT
jgi:DNA-binding response OmpR family regulator